MSQPDRDSSRPMLQRLRWVGGAFLFVAVVIVAQGMASRAAQSARLHELTEAEAVPTVAIVTPTPAQDHAGLVLPGRRRDAGLDRPRSLRRGLRRARRQAWIGISISARLEPVHHPDGHSGSNGEGAETTPPAFLKAH